MSQNTTILKKLRKGYRLDPLGVLREFNCWSLRSRICELEGKSGCHRMLKPNETIKRIPVKSNGKRYMSYKLVTA